VDGSDIGRVIVAPTAAHSLRTFMVWHHIVVLRELANAQILSSAMILRFSRFRITAGLSLRIGSRPQHNRDLWI
jgi:hypothetical protein